MNEAKTLKDAFNGITQIAKYSDTILQVTQNKINYFYDFAARMMTMRMDWGNDYNVTSTPFAQVDREVLVAARDKLVELGGTPPDLPAEPGTLQKPVRGLNP